MVTAEQVAARASKALGQPVTPEVVRAVKLATSELRAQERQRRAVEGPEWIRCVCGCARVFARRHPNEKIHPACRERVYRDRGLMALCKGRTPVVVAASPPAGAAEPATWPSGGAPPLQNGRGHRDHRGQLLRILGN